MPAPASRCHLSAQLTTQSTARQERSSRKPCIAKVAAVQSNDVVSATRTLRLFSHEREKGTIHPFCDRDCLHLATVFVHCF